MADPTVAVVLTLKDKLSGALKKVTSDITKQLDGVAERFNKIFGTKITGTQLAAGIGIVAGAVTALGTALYKTAQQTMEYALSIGDMSTALGITAEEASTLVQIGDDLRISQGSLTVAFRTLARQGVQPTIENIKELAAQYKAIEDPAKKSQFALQMFGRQGLQLTRLLALTNDEIDAMAQSAQAAGLIMSEEGVQAAKDYYAQIDNLQDQVEGLKISIGNGLIPVLSDLAGELNRVITEAQLSNTYYTLLKVALDNNIISMEEYDAALKDVAASSSLTNKEAYDFSKAMKEVKIRIDVANEVAGTLGSYAIPQITDAMTDASGELATWAKLIGFLKTDEEKIALATKLWGKEISVANKQILLNEKAILVDQIAMGGLTEEVEAGKLAQLGLIDAQLSVIDIMDQVAGATDSASFAVEKYSQSFVLLGDEIEKAQSKTNSFLEIADKDIGSPIKSFIEDLQYMMAGGAEIALAFEGIKKAFNEGKITPEEAKDWFKQLYVANEEVMVNAGLETKDEAKANIDEALKEPIADAKIELDGFNSTLEMMTATSHELGLDVIVSLSGDKWILEWMMSNLYSGKIKIPQGIGVEAGLPGGQHGLNMVVPPGYPNDTYAVRASSGEHVQITPAGKVQPTTVIINQTFNDEGSAALGLAMTRKMATGRLNNSMGR